MFFGGGRLTLCFSSSSFGEDAVGGLIFSGGGKILIIFGSMILGGSGAGNIFFSMSTLGKNLAGTWSLVFQIFWSSVEGAPAAETAVAAPVDSP